MGNRESIAIGKIDGTKGGHARRRAGIRKIQNVVLIWLDNNIDEENNADCRNTVTQLRRIINTINTFTDGEECIEFIKTINNEKICMIISGSLGEHIVPRVHNLSQVDSIFIFCANRTKHEQWITEWSKIKGVFTEVLPICEALEQASQQCKQNAILMSFMITTSDISNRNLNQLDCLFMYTQILKEILLEIKFDKTHIEEFTRYCCDLFNDNDKELADIKELNQKYYKKTPIWWYTRETFLYSMLNRAIRTMDVDIIIKIGFFIVDLHCHIEKLHSKQFNRHRDYNLFTVYRGQGMSKADFEQMEKTTGGLIAFNNFLSTSKNQDISLKFAHSALANPDLVGILFVMEIDPSKSAVPFASITSVSCFKHKEDEVLFSMNTVFRINNIKQMDENHRLFQVNLTLTSDNDKDLRTLTDRMRQETQGSQGWYRLGVLLFKIGQTDKAQELYHVLLNQARSKSDKMLIYNQLGRAKDELGEYQEAIKYYEKSLNISQKGYFPENFNLTLLYNNIGIVYRKLGDYPKALSYYEKALKIRQVLLREDDPDLASSFNSIGALYYHMGEHSEALSFYEKALAILQLSLPSNHPSLAMCYNNIGLVYCAMNEFSKALLFHEKALEIKQRALPSNHPDLANSYNSIGIDYRKMGEHSKALSSYEKALTILQQSLPTNHPDLADPYNNIGVIYDEMGEYSKALSYYEKALEIKQKTLSPDHPILATFHYNIGFVYEKMGDYLKARSFYERSTDIGQRALPSTHPDLQKWRKNLEDVKQKI